MIRIRKFKMLAVCTCVMVYVLFFYDNTWTSLPILLFSVDKAPLLAEGPTATSCSICTAKGSRKVVIKQEGVESRGTAGRSVGPGVCFLRG